VKVHTFLHVVFQKGAWKKVWAEAGRITYIATQDRASIEIVCSDQDQPLRYKAAKKTKVAISGNSIHLPDNLM
jgi:hypothetical protein